MKTLCSPLACLTALLLTAAVSARGSITIYPTSHGDGFFVDVVGTIFDSWDDTSPSLSAHYQFFGTSDTFQRNTAYIQISLSGLPPGTVLNAAYLHLYFESAYLTAPTPSAGFIYHVANSSLANGYASQKLEGTELVYEVFPPISGWLMLDVLAYVQHDIDNGYPYACFSLHANSTGTYSDRYAGFSVTSSDASDNRPFLRLELIPEPTTVLLVLLACGMIAPWVRRSR